MRMLKGENVIVAAHVGAGPVTLVAATGALVTVPAEQGRRDGAGARLETALAAVAPTC